MRAVQARPSHLAVYGQYDFGADTRHCPEIECGLVPVLAERPHTLREQVCRLLRAPPGRRVPTSQQWS